MHSTAHFIVVFMYFNYLLITIVFKFNGCTYAHTVSSTVGLNTFQSMHMHVDETTSLRMIQFTGL